MKKKFTVNTLALGNLKARKKQYAIMLIGIILAMVFSSGIIFSVSSIFSSVESITKSKFGNYDFMYANADKELVSTGQNEKLFGECGYGRILGNAYSTDNSNYDFAVVAALDDTAYKLLNPVLSKGTYPTNENEIAIEAITLSKMNISAEIGDEIVFNFKVQNGQEVFENSVQKKYKLVGVLENKANNICFSSGLDSADVPSAFVGSSATVDLGGKEKLVCYGDFYDENITQESYKKVEKFFVNNSIENFGRYFFIVSENEAFHLNEDTATDVTFQVVFIIVVAAVLMLSACLFIVNAFNSNLKDRKKQIGMLRAVGATKNQIISAYGREALIISLIATPISIAVSYFVVKGIISLLGDEYSFTPEWWVFILSALFGIGCVMLAFLIPLVSASKISPIQAIRNIENTRTLNEKHIKSKKEFNVSTLMAKRSLIFDRRKNAAVTLMLIISIVASGYTFSYYTYQRDNLLTTAYDYELSLKSDSWSGNGVNYRNENNGFSETDRFLAESCDYIGSSNGIKRAFSNILTDYSSSDYRKQVSNRYEKDYEKYADSDINKENYQDALFSKQYNASDGIKMAEMFGTDNYISTDIVSFDSDYIEKLSKYVWDGEINISKINSGEEILLVAPKNIGVRYEGGDYEGIYTVTNKDTNGEDCIFFGECDFHAGDEIEIAFVTAPSQSDSEGSTETTSSIPDNAVVTKHKVKIGAIIQLDKSALKHYFFGDFALLTTNNVMDKYVDGLRYKEITLDLDSECTDEIDKSVMSILNTVAENVDQADVLSNYGYQIMQQQDLEKFTIIITAVIVFVFTIAISVINNTITSSIRNSKHKIGTLRAVGADKNTLVRSYTMQIFSMLLWGVSIGLGGFVLSFITAFIVCRLNEKTFALTFNPLASLAFVFALIVICYLNLWLKIKKEMKNSIIDNIREL